MKQRFFLYVSVFALLIGVLVFSGAGSQAVAQQRPPGGDSIHVPPPSPDPGIPSVIVRCSYDKTKKCGVKCRNCWHIYYGLVTDKGYPSSYSGICSVCGGALYDPIPGN